MAERPLGFQKPSVPNVKEQAARITLRNVRSQGHTYVDLREDGKRYVFFCTLCLAPCYSEKVLFDHLNGNLHKERLLAAKATLIGDNPWPFDDGVLFFNCNSHVEEKVVSKNDRQHVDNLAIVVGNCVSRMGGGEDENTGDGDNLHDCNSEHNNNNNNGEGGIDLVIPGVIVKDRISDLNVRLIGYGKISSRLLEKDGACARIWCEWLGKMGSADGKTGSCVPSHDFAIVTFCYCYDLGKQGLFEEIKTRLLMGREESSDGDGSKKRRKKSLSDSEDASALLTHQYDSSGDDSQVSTSTTSSALLLNQYDDQLLHSRIISSKSLRRELRKKQRVASERLCDICQHKMLPGKDVATLLNLKTGRLACSSRNVHGAFHVFHTSCLIHWILLCENEMFVKPPVKSKVRRRSKRTKPKLSQIGKECGPDSYGLKHKTTRKGSEEGAFFDKITSVFCPDCEGTGLQINGDELEKPTVPLSEIFKFKIKAIDAHRLWMESPEKLENCSTGFAFPGVVDAEGKVSDLKLVHFYRAEDRCSRSS